MLGEFRRGGKGTSDSFESFWRVLTRCSSLSRQSGSRNTCGRPVDSVRVSNELGANKPGRARLALHTSIGLALLVGAGVSLLLLLVRKQWALLFTSADETGVIALVSQLMPLVVASQFGVALQAILSGEPPIPASRGPFCVPSNNDRLELSTEEPVRVVRRVC